MKCPGGGTSSRQTNLMSLWARFNLFKPERWARAQSTEPNSLVLIQTVEEREWFVAGPSFL